MNQEQYYFDIHLIKIKFQGEYYYRNVSIDADKFGSEFSLSTDKYWEYYWKVNVVGYITDRIKFFITDLEFYFIQFRSRQRQN